MGRVERDRELARRRSRRAKLKKLRERYARASTKADKQAIINKVRKVSPLVDLEAERKAAEKPAAAPAEPQAEPAVEPAAESQEA